jgi:hypothetical protein
MAVADAPTLAQVLARQGALSPAAALVVLREVAAQVAAREGAGAPIGEISAEQVWLERTGRAHLAEVPEEGSPSASAPASPAPSPAANASAPAASGAAANASAVALSRLGFTMLRGSAGTADDRDVLPERLTGGEMPAGFGKVLSQGVSGGVPSTAAFVAALQAVPLRPEERRAAMEQLNRMAVRAWTLAPRSAGGSDASSVRSSAAAPAPKGRRWAIIAALVVATAGAWWERDHLFGSATPDEDASATLALARRAQRLRSSTDADSLPVETQGTDSALVRDSAAARLAGATTSGAVGGEAEASLAGDPLVEGIKALEAGRTREAIPLLQQAIARDANDPAPHGYLACAYRRAGRGAEADRALAKAGSVPGPWSGCARKGA